MTWSAACAAASLLCGVAHAADDRGLHGAIGVTVQYDNNLFRLPDGVLPSAAGITRDADDDGSNRGDTIYSPFVSLEASLALGRQHFGLSALRRETRLDRYGAYNTQTGDLRAQWDWELGNELAGRIDAGNSDQATDLQDFVGTRRNVLNVRDENVTAHWRPRPDRRLSVEFHRYRGSNDLPERATSDYAVHLWSLEGAWVTPLGTELTLRWRNTDGLYPNRTVGETAPIDNSYHQNDTDIGVVLRPGARTRGELRVGYAVRHHDQVPQRDFEGPSGRAEVEWQATGAVSLNLEAVRDLNALDDLDRLFAISTRYAVGARWAVSAQWQLALRWSDQHIDFGGDPQNVLTQTFGQAPARHDRVQTTRLALTWIPVTSVQVEMSFEQTHRDSSRPELQYSNKLAGLSTRYAF